MFILVFEDMHCHNLNVFVFRLVLEDIHCPAMYYSLPQFKCVCVYVPPCVSGHSLSETGMWFDKILGPRFRWWGLQCRQCRLYILVFCLEFVRFVCLSLGHNFPPFLLLVVFVCFVLIFGTCYLDQHSV